MANDPPSPSGPDDNLLGLVLAAIGSVVILLDGQGRVRLWNPVAERLLGIPTILDRVIQQAIAHVLTPIFEPTFSASSPRAVRFRHFWQTFCWTSSTRNWKGGVIALPATRTIWSFWSKASGPGSA